MKMKKFYLTDPFKVEDKEERLTKVLDDDEEDSEMMIFMCKMMMMMMLDWLIGEDIGPVHDNEDADDYDNYYDTDEDEDHHKLMKGIMILLMLMIKVMMMHTLASFYKLALTRKYK